MNRHLFCTLAIVLSSIFIFTLISCRRAKPPDKEPETETIVQEKPSDDIQSDVRVFPAIAIEAGNSGKEFELENIKFTHMAISADEDYEYSVSVVVTVNDVPAGILYADGWEDESPEKLKISAGDISKWVPIRGEWNPMSGMNLMKLTFTHLTIKGLKTPPKYFEGKLWLKYDPDADETAIGQTMDEGDTTVSVDNPAD